MAAYFIAIGTTWALCLYVSPPLISNRVARVSVASMGRLTQTTGASRRAPVGSGYLPVCLPRAVPGKLHMAVLLIVLLEAYEQSVFL